MSYDRFFELLQMLITMTDPGDKEAVQDAKAILEHLLQLGGNSGMMDEYTIQSIRGAYRDFEALLHRKSDFAGIPGDGEGNKVRRRRLSMAVYPHC